MNKAAVHPSVAVLEGVDRGEAEPRGRRLADGIDAVLTHAVVRFQQARHQIREILRSSADEVRERIAVMVALADAYTVRAEARANEPRVFDETALRPQDLVQRERVFAGLEDSAPPALKPV